MKSLQTKIFQKKKKFLHYYLSYSNLQHSRRDKNSLDKKMNMETMEK